MIYAMIIILFILSNVLLFLVDNFIVINIILAISMGLFFICQIRFRDYISFLIKNLLFIVFIFGCNMLFSSFYSALLISLKLFIAIELTYVISKKVSATNFALGFYYILYPLKLFKVNVKDITLTISIALTFIPILKNETKQVRLALKSKGFNFSIRNVLFKPQIFLVSYLNGLFNRIDEIEKALIMKGFC